MTETTVANISENESLKRGWGRGRFRDFLRQEGIRKRKDMMAVGEDGNGGGI